jgi:hypothetical protein
VTTKTGYLVNTSRVDLSVLVIWYIFTVCMSRAARASRMYSSGTFGGIPFSTVEFGECREVGMYDIPILQLGFLIVQYCSPALTLYTEGACSTWFLLP